VQPYRLDQGDRVNQVFVSNAIDFKRIEDLDVVLLDDLLSHQTHLG